MDRAKPGLLALGAVILLLAIWSAWIAAASPPASRQPAGWMSH